MERPGEEPPGDAPAHRPPSPSPPPRSASPQPSGGPSTSAGGGGGGVGDGPAAPADEHGEVDEERQKTRRRTQPGSPLPRAGAPGRKNSPPPRRKHNAVIVWLRPTGDAPILKQQRVRVARGDPFARVVAALRTKTRAPAVLAYVREAFVPPLDATVGDLAAAYGTHGGGRLTVNYALAPAWG